MIKFIGCVAEKFTKKQMSAVFEFYAFSYYHACDKLEEISGIAINGESNYADLCEIEEN
jgi:hypothetical protein